MSLQELMQRAGIWRAGEMPAGAAEPTGFQALDQTLPGGGWPRTGLTEILAADATPGALRLVLPALVRLSHEGRWIVLVSPPHIPYAPALQDAGMDLRRVLIVDLPAPESPLSHAVRAGHGSRAAGTADDSAHNNEILWAYEQALRFGDCAAALLWPGRLAPLQLRRLQLAAESGATWGVLFRPLETAQQASPARLRLKLDVPGSPGSSAASSGPAAAGHGFDVTVLKAAGARAGRRCRIEV